ncbi:hypothetical protein CHELA41_20372 [Hyphomicrobiales bacterium]|nr:hypothetical protein CHELA41_20372 [Hyphomicrobiales bacterium]
MHDKKHIGAGWSSPVARQAHNLKVTGSNPVPATNYSLDVPFRAPAASFSLRGKEGCLIREYRVA